MDTSTYSTSSHAEVAWQTVIRAEGGFPAEVQASGFWRKFGERTKTKPRERGTSGRQRLIQPERGDFKSSRSPEIASPDTNRRSNWTLPWRVGWGWT